MRFRVCLLIITSAIAYSAHSIKTSTYVRALDKVICEFLDQLKPEDFCKLCRYIESYNNYTKAFVDRLKVKDVEFRRMAIVHCDWGKPTFTQYHDKLWYEVWMEWNCTYIERLDALVNTTVTLWIEYSRLCKGGNYSAYLNRFIDYPNSSAEILVE